MDTTNKYMVGVQDDKIVIRIPPPGAISKADAMMLAAWLVTLADDHEDFTDYLAAVQSQPLPTPNTTSPGFDRTGE